MYPMKAAHQVKETNTRGALLQRGLRLEYLSLGWNAIAGTGAVLTGLGAASVALLGFGLDVAIDSLASSILVWRWLRRYGEGGAAAVADAPRAGRPPRADAAYRQALERAVETRPRDLGLPFDVWTSARLSAYLAQTTGVHIAPGWLRVLLAQQDFACGRPKHTLGHLQDPAEVAACKAELAAAEKN
jgi:transposase